VITDNIGKEEIRVKYLLGSANAFQFSLSRFYGKYYCFDWEVDVEARRKIIYIILNDF